MAPSESRPTVQPGQNAADFLLPLVSEDGRLALGEYRRCSRIVVVDGARIAARLEERRAGSTSRWCVGPTGPSAAGAGEENGTAHHRLRELPKATPVMKAPTRGSA